MSELESHLDNFKEWMENSDNKTGEKSVENYYTTVRGFYRNTGRKQPIDLTNDSDEYLEELSHDIANHITSRSMKFGLKKYLSWISLQTSSFQAEKTAGFMREKIGRVPLDQDQQDVESKVIAGQTLGSVCRKAEETDNQLGIMLRMMYESASRFSGMNRLLWRDVWRNEFSGEELEAHQVYISKERSKGKVNGVVEISDQTLSDLEKMADERNPDRNEQVFFPEMTNPSTYQKAWRFFDNHYQEYSTHYFRHSRLTHLGMQMHEEEGMEYPEIKEKLRRYARHKNSDTTELYTEIVKDKLAQRNQDMAKYRKVDWN